MDFGMPAVALTTGEYRIMYQWWVDDEVSHFSFLCSQRFDYISHLAEAQALQFNRWGTVCYLKPLKTRNKVEVQKSATFVKNEQYTGMMVAEELKNTQPI